MNRDQSTKAMVAAIVLLLSSGWFYRVAADRYASAFDSLPIPAGSLAQLPTEIGEWVGTDVDLDPAIVERTDSDDHVNRAYVNESSREAVSLYFALGGRGRDLLPHRPEVCYPAAGWVLGNTKRVDLASPAGSVIPCTIYSFSRGSLGSQRILVLNYYIINGSASADVSEMRSHAVATQKQLTYFARVQITSQFITSGRDADAAVLAFAEQSTEPIFSLLSKLEREYMSADATTAESNQ